MTQSNSIKLTAARASRPGAARPEANDPVQPDKQQGNGPYLIISSTMSSWTEDAGIRHALAETRVRHLPCTCHLARCNGPRPGCELPTASRGTGSLEWFHEGSELLTALTNEADRERSSLQTSCSPQVNLACDGSGFDQVDFDQRER